MFIKVQEMEKTIKEQKILIGQLEREVMHQNITIMTLTKQFGSNMPQATALVSSIATDE